MISLRLVLALLISFMSLVCALIAFLPTYISGVKAVDETISDLRNNTVNKANTDMLLFLDTPLKQLGQAYNLFHSGLVDPSNTTGLLKWMAETVEDNRAIISVMQLTIWNQSSAVAPQTKVQHYLYLDTQISPTQVHIGLLVDNATHYGVDIYGVDLQTLETSRTFASRLQRLPRGTIEISQRIAVSLSPEMDAIEYPGPKLGFRPPNRALRTLFIPASVELRTSDGQIAGLLQFNLLLDDVTRVLQNLGLRENGAAICYDALSTLTLGSSWGEELFELTAQFSNFAAPAWQRMLLKTLLNFTDNSFMKDEIVPAIGYQRLIGSTSTSDTFAPISKNLDTSSFGSTYVDVFEVRKVGARFRIILAMPEVDFKGSINRNRTAAIIGAVFAILVTLILAIFIAHSLIAPLGELRERMALSARFQDRSGGDDANSTSQDVYSVLSEVAEMQEAYYAMRDELNRAKVYLPQSVLNNQDGEEEGEGEGDIVTSIDRGTALSQMLERRKKRRASNASSTMSASRYSQSVTGTTEVSASSGSEGGGSLNTAVSVTPKRVAIVVFNLTDFGLQAGGAMTSLHTRYLETIYKHVKANKGVIDYFQGDRVVCSFNAVNTVAAYIRRATNAALAVTHDLEKDAHMPRCSIGISAGTALVGNLGTSDVRRFCIVGQVVIQALMMERLNKHFKGKTKILAPHLVISELATDFTIQHVGIFKLPRKKLENQPVVVSSIEGMKDQGESQEWMYQVEEGNKKDPYLPGNQLFMCLLEQGVPEARDMADKLLATYSSPAQQPVEVPMTGIEGQKSAPDLEASGGGVGSGAGLSESSNSLSKGASVAPEAVLGFENAIATLIDAERCGNGGGDLGISLSAFSECFY